MTEKRITRDSYTLLDKFSVKKIDRLTYIFRNKFNIYIYLFDEFTPFKPPVIMKINPFTKRVISPWFIKNQDFFQNWNYNYKIDSVIDFVNNLETNCEINELFNTFLNIIENLDVKIDNIYKIEINERRVFINNFNNYELYIKVLKVMSDEIFEGIFNDLILKIKDLFKDIKTKFNSKRNIFI